MKKVNINKSKKQCYDRWKNNKEKNESYKFKWVTRRKWSIAEEKELLRILHLQKEDPDWNEISKLMKKVNINKSATQCNSK